MNAPYLFSALIGAGALFAMSAAMIAIVFSASRLVYQIGKDGLLPRITRSFDHRKSVAPSGIWISAAVSIALLFSGGLYTILSISNFGVLFSLLMACFALVNMHRRRRLGSFVAPYYPYLTLISIAACIIFMFGLPEPEPCPGSDHNRLPSGGLLHPVGGEAKGGSKDKALRLNEQGLDSCLIIRVNQ